MHVAELLPANPSAETVCVTDLAEKIDFKAGHPVAQILEKASTKVIVHYCTRHKADAETKFKTCYMQSCCGCGCPPKSLERCADICAYYEDRS